MLLWFLALALADAPLPAAVPPVRYVVVDAPGTPTPGFAAFIAREAPTLRRAEGPATPFQACTEGSPSHQVNRCVRALLPAPDAAGPTIAFVVQPVARSNVTGSVVHHSHAIHCVGPRGIGRIGLSGLWPEVEAQDIAARLPECIAAALETGWRGGVRVEGNDHWRFPITADRLAADGPQARGWGTESAIVQVIEAETTHRITGRCALSGRIVHVEAGRRLRAGDRFEVAIPCRWEGEDRASRMFTQSFGAGASARLYLRYEDGAVAYLEAL
jgi:hypothetical protein